MKSGQVGIREITLRSRFSIESLKDLDLDILQMTADGYKVEDIAIKWELSIHTIKLYKHRILYILGADNSVQAIAIAFRKGLIK